MLKKILSDFWRTLRRGKTIVAALGLLAAYGNGHQGAFMAPTEVLANQHFRTLTELFNRVVDPPRVILHTGSTPKKLRDAALAEIKEGTAHIVIGTHAVLSGDVEFKSLGLAVVDEQHRFGWGLGWRFGIRTDSVEGRTRTDSGGCREVSTPETNPRYNAISPAGNTILTMCA